MRAFSVFFTALLFLVTAQAATVINPVLGSVWNASSQGQLLAWTYVASDPPSFSVALANQLQSPPINIVVKQNVTTSDGSTTLNGPSSGWPTGPGFQLNIVQINSNGTQILAQSQQFSINGTTVPFTSSSVSPSGTSTGSSPTSTGKNGAMGLTVQTSFIAGLALVGALLA